MRIVFLGTADFAVPSLRHCNEQHDVVAVVSQPDKAGSRGRPAARPVADVARELHIPLLTPPRVRDPQSLAEIAALQPDALVVAAYGQILPQALLDIPRLAPVNVHGSLLPRWRGASPVAHAILAGDTESGVTIMRMDAGLDTGPMYSRTPVDIPEDATAPALTATLASAGAVALDGVLQQLEDGSATVTAQPDDGVTLAPRLTREDGAVTWEECTAVDVDRRVRAFDPWPGVTANLGGAPVRILAGAREPGGDSGAAATPGDVIRIDGESVVVATRAGGYRVDRVVPAGSRAMSAAAYLRGRRSVH
ncbi:MAG: methionyl-tRNA formyltransferase [Candidatus Dormibacteria bacterium]